MPRLHYKIAPTKQDYVGFTFLPLWGTTRAFLSAFYSQIRILWLQKWGKRAMNAVFTVQIMPKARSLIPD